MIKELSLKYLVSFILEPTAQFLYLAAISYCLWKVDRSNRFKMIWVYYLIGFLILFKILFTRHNSYLYSLLYVTTSVGFGFYFYTLFESRVKKWFAIFPGLITLVYYLTKTITGGEPLFPSIGFIISSTGIIILIFIYLYDLMTHVKEDALSRNFDFWFICSQLVYHLGAFGIFLTYNHLTAKILAAEHYSVKNRELLTYLWGVHNVLLFLGSLLTWFGIVWIVSRRRSTLL
jgi:hypothetical protein